MKKFSILVLSVMILAMLVGTAQANSLCAGKEGSWIVPPKQEKAFGNYYLGGLCDENSCYHIAISNDAEGEDLVALAFTCEEPGDGTQQIQWVLADVKTGEKQEIQANSAEINQVLMQATNAAASDADPAEQPNAQQGEQSDWTSACNGQIPASAKPQGHEASGESLWVARAQLVSDPGGEDLGTYPGKVRPGFGGANIPYEGEEVAAKCYDVWTGPAGHWKAASNGDIPEGAVIGGQDAQGNTLYIARVNYKGGLQLGMVSPGLGAAVIPYGGKEVSIAQYEVLCR